MRQLSKALLFKIVLISSCFLCQNIKGDNLVTKVKISNNGTFGDKNQTNKNESVINFIAFLSSRFGECAGVVLHSQWIITSAHCLVDENENKLFNTEIMVSNFISNGVFFKKHYW